MSSLFLWILKYINNENFLRANDYVRENLVIKTIIAALQGGVEKRGSIMLGDYWLLTIDYRLGNLEIF